MSSGRPEGQPLTIRTVSVAPEENEPIIPSAEWPDEPEICGCIADEPTIEGLA